MSYEGPGVYRHYKGGHYRAWGVAQHESMGAKLVIYSSYDLDHDLGRWAEGVDFVARPLNPEDGEDAFNESVFGVAADRDMPVARFTRVARA